MVRTKATNSVRPLEVFNCHWYISMERKLVWFQTSTEANGEEHLRIKTMPITSLSAQSNYLIRNADGNDQRHDVFQFTVRGSSSRQQKCILNRNNAVFDLAKVKAISEKFNINEDEVPKHSPLMAIFSSKASITGDDGSSSPYTLSKLAGIYTLVCLYYVMIIHKWVQ